MESCVLYPGPKPTSPKIPFSSFQFYPSATHLHHSLSAFNFHNLHGLFCLWYTVSLSEKTGKQRTFPSFLSPSPPSFSIHYFFVISPTRLSLPLSISLGLFSADLMSKKMKGVAMESSIHGSFMYKHQRLIQDYQKLEKETKAAKTKVEVVKQKKLTLLAEVCFLQQRHKHLLEMKLENPHEQRMLQRPILQTRHISSTKEKNGGKKEMKEMGSSSKRLVFEKNQSFVSQKEKKINGKKVLPGKKSLGFNLNQKERSEVLLLKQKEKKNMDFDLNQMEKSYAEREEAVLNKAPIFDLNLKLGEEEDFQENYEKSVSVDPDNTFRGGNEEQINDLKLSICRNVENVPSRSGKRKITWQDPVALKA